MVDERRLHQMISLARFKQRNKDSAFRINRSQRGDYVGVALIRNFMLTTIAYFFLLAAVGLLASDFIISHINEMNFKAVAAVLVLGYLVFLALYSVITLTMARLRYERAERNIEIYYRQLDVLKRMYREEEKEQEEAEAIKAFEEGYRHG